MSERPELSGVILEESTTLSLVDISGACSVHAEYIIELVEEGVIDPEHAEGERWRFSGECLSRVRRAVALQRDLGLNLAGTALALDLLDELERLRSRLRSLDSDF